MKIAAMVTAGAAALLVAVLLDVGRRDLPAPPARTIVLQPATATTAPGPTSTVTGPPGTYDRVDREVESYSDDARGHGSGSGTSGSGSSGSGSSGSGHSGSGTDSGGSGG